MAIAEKIPKTGFEVDAAELLSLFYGQLDRVAGRLSEQVARERQGIDRSKPVIVEREDVIEASRILFGVLRKSTDDENLLKELSEIENCFNSKA